MTLRPLPRSLAPLPDESLPGFLLRLATRLDRSPSRLATLCGLTERPGRIPLGLLQELPDTTARAFAHAAGLSIAEANDLTLQRFATPYPPLRAVRAVPQRTTVMLATQWALDFSTRYCPQCLHGDASEIQQALRITAERGLRPQEGSPGEHRRRPGDGRNGHSGSAGCCPVTPPRALARSLAPLPADPLEEDLGGAGPGEAAGELLAGVGEYLGRDPVESHGAHECVGHRPARRCSQHL